jgi:DNA-binding response OmpR family regulator
MSIRRTVLLVEDDRATRDLFDYSLRIAGFHVLPANDGLVALRLLEQHHPDAVVLDLDLPHVSGFDVHRELMAHADTRSVPIVVVTGTEWEVPLAVFRVLRKPVTGDAVVLAVQHALDESQRS